MKVAVCTVGIDGWEDYTRPLIESVLKHEPNTTISVIDNASAIGYLSRAPVEWDHRVKITRSHEKLCYAAGLNLAHDAADELNGPHDWYIFLGNDTLCSGPFHHILRQAPPGIIAGIGIYKIIHYRFVSGWGMVIPRSTWEIVGRFDEDYIVSAWEDVDYSYRVELAGLRLHKFEGWPIFHVDQQQRQRRWAIDHVHIWNGALFERKHNIPLPLCRYSGGQLLKDRWA
jgi:GT2 family glycosyltransferase